MKKIEDILKNIDENMIFDENTKIELLEELIEYQDKIVDINECG